MLIITSVYIKTPNNYYQLLSCIINKNLIIGFIGIDSPCILQDPDHKSLFLLNLFYSEQI